MRQTLLFLFFTYSVFCCVAAAINIEADYVKQGGGKIGTQYVGGGGQEIDADYYVVRFNKPVENSTTITISILGANGWMWVEGNKNMMNHGSTTYNVPKGSTGFGLYVIWTEPGSLVTFSIGTKSPSSSGDWIYMSSRKEAFKVERKPIKIIGPQQVVMGETVEYRVEDYNFKSMSGKGSGVKWVYDTYLFKYESERYDPVLKCRFLVLKAQTNIAQTSIKVKILDNIVGQNNPMEVRNGDLSVSIIDPFTLSKSPEIACKGSLVKYTLKNSHPNSLKVESISWDTQLSNIELVSGQGTTQATFKIKENGYAGPVRVTVKMEGIADGISKISARFWAGSPQNNGLSDQVYEIHDRTTIKLVNDRKKILGVVKDIRWEYLSGSKEYDVVSESSDEFVIQTRLKSYQKGKTVFKCIISNDCGSIEFLHTVNVHEAEGVSFENPINLGVISNASLDKFLGSTEDTKLFQNKIGGAGNEVYYTFEVGEDIAELSFNVSGDKDAVYYLFNENMEAIDGFEDTIMLWRGKFYVVGEFVSGDGVLTTNVSYLTTGQISRRPIRIKTSDKGFHFSDFRDLGKPLYDNQLGDPSSGKEVYYKFSISEPMDIFMHAVGSHNGALEIYLAEAGSADGVYHILRSHKCNPIISPYDISKGFYGWGHDPKVENLPPGDYYIISEGYKATNGSLLNTLTCTNIEAYPAGTSPKNLIANVNSAPDLSELNLLRKGTKLKFEVDTKNRGYYNTYVYQNKGDEYWIIPSNGREVYHKIKLDEPMDVTINHNGSELENTYIHVTTDGYSRPIISVKGRMNEGTGQANVELKNLAAGTYYIISEGFRWGDSDKFDGKILVNIESQAPGSHLRTFATTMAEEEITKTSIHLTPNPASSTVDLIINTDAELIKGSYQIFNILGGLAQKGKLSDKQTSIDVSNLTKGVYVVYAIVGNENYSTRLIVQ